MPFGAATTHGTLVVGFSAEQGRLGRMAGVEDGIRDALTYDATTLTGAYYVVPPVDARRAYAAPDARAA